jgi:arylsulfatase
MTGRHALRSGNQTLPFGGGMYGLVQWEVTLARLLSGQGYATGHFGKWHLGDSDGRYPTDQGFDEWYGIPNTSDESLWPTQPGYDPEVVPMTHILEGRKGKPTSKVALFDVNTRPEVDMEITRRTIDFMKRSAAEKKPFYAYVPYTLVHYPTLPSAEFKGKTGYGDWADCLAQMDHNVGRLLDTIDELGLRDDTVFVFTSDNGPDPTTVPGTNSFGLGTSGPWTGAAFTPMEGNNRVPFIVRWPGQIPADRESNEVVHEVDTFTTLARFAGAEIPQDRPIDGVDQRDFFQGKTDSSAREGFLIYFGDKLYGAKWRHFKVLFVEQTDPRGAVQSLGVPRIYDLHSNPKEWPEQNVIADHLWVLHPVARMTAEYQASLKEHPPIVPGTHDPYVPSKRTTI